jgi:acetyl esterase/lipase
MPTPRWFPLPPRLTRARGIIGAAAFAACSSTAVDGGSGGVDNGREAIAPASRCAAESVAVSAIRVARGVTYVTRQRRPLQFDVAWSEQGPPAPLVLLLHGGGWSGGSRASLGEEMRAFARRGYTAATVEYRLAQAGRNVFPAAIADVRCALRALRRRASDYHIEPGRVVAVGFSAGGHLASLLGTGADVRGLDGDCPDADLSGGDNDIRVQAVVAYAAPQDLRVDGPYTREQAELVTNFLGVFPGNDLAIATLASPIAHVSAGDPPFLLVHGAGDELVPVRHARRMAAALRAVGTPASVLELRVVGHAFVGLASSDVARVRCTVDAFLARWLGRPTG